MFEDLKKAIVQFKDSKSIVLFTPTIKMIDKAVSIIALSKICSTQGKSFQVICPADLTNSIRDMLVSEGIEVSIEPQSQEYVVSVDYSDTRIEKVVCKRDEETKKLNFIITPGDDLFNFEKVDLISGGKAFDLLISLGTKDLKDIDEKYKDLFQNSPVISITKKETSIGDYKFLINGSKSYSEVIFEFVKALSRDVSEEMLNLLLQGIVSRYRLFEGGGDNNGWSLVSKLIKYGADFNKVMKALYYDKDVSNLELQKKIMQNLRMEKESKVVWSEVYLQDGSFTNIDLRGRISFNISRDFDLAFVLYHVNTESIKVVLESNDVKKYSAIKIANTFGGYGTESRAMFSNKGIPAQDFVKRFFETLESLYGIRVDFTE